MAANFPILITDLNTDSGKLTETYADNNNNKPHTWTHSSEIAAHQKQRSTTKYLHKNDSSYNGSQKKKMMQTIFKVKKMTIKELYVQ